MERKRVRLAAAAAALLMSAAAEASVVVYDDFDDGSLNGAWNVAFVNTNSWTYSESGTLLRCTDIPDFTLNQDWARVRLSVPIGPLGDFRADFDFSWDSEGSGDAMQNVFIRLLDGPGSVVASSGAWDAWRLNPGTRHAQVGATSLPSSPGSLPLTGSAQVDIDRTGSNVSIAWNGATILTGTESALVEVVEIEFSFYLQSGSTVSFFGNEAVDLIQVEALSGPALLPEMDVRGNGVSIADGDATPSAADDTDFGSVEVAGGAAQRSFSIENGGQAVLFLTGSPAVQISGPHAADFSVLAQPSTAVPAGGGATSFTVEFTPSGLGTRSATLTIANDDSDENPYDFAIQGTGAPTLVPSLSPAGLALLGALLMAAALGLARRRPAARGPRP